MGEPSQVPLCDRCGAIITLTGYRATSKDGRSELLLCTVHEREHDAVLTKYDWRIERLSPPDPEFGLKVRTCCGRCGGVAHSRPVKATPESLTVDVVHCKDCDTRTCGYVIGGNQHGEIKCDSKPLTQDERLCPKGHVLMGSDA